MLQFLPCYVGYHVCAFFLSRVQAINSDTYIYPRMPARARPHTNTHTHINICMTDDWEAMFPSCEHNFIQVDNGTNNADWHITVMTWLTKSYWIDFCPTQIHLRLSAVTSTISHTGGPKHAVHVTSRTMDNCSLQLLTPLGRLYVPVQITCYSIAADRLLYSYSCLTPTYFVGIWRGRLSWASQLISTVFLTLLSQHRAVVNLSNTGAAIQHWLLLDAWEVWDPSTHYPWRSFWFLTLDRETSGKL